ncbi:hypothetical protein [Methylobrevis pamukkalensis]|uniref:hypothetical protein n=1 Tax=Methylobrevis pamukkalensis TaxID=1439726 RepID=UPI001FD9DF8E|nr:hypothetical protein [Methylobrevis pamukkalensis]
MAKLEDGCDHVAPLAPPIVAAQASEIGEEPRAACAVRALGHFGNEERQEVGTGDAIGIRRPIAPAIRSLDDRAIVLACELRASLLDPLHVVEELQEHDPGEHRQPIKVAIQPLVLPHDLAGGLDDAVETLGSGQLLRRSLLTGGSGQGRSPSIQAV